MAHQLSGHDEHPHGAVNQYNGCCLFRSRRWGGIGSIRYCRNLLSGSLYAGLRVQYWTSSDDCPEKRGTELSGNRKDFLSGAILFIGISRLALPIDSCRFSLSIETVNFLTGDLSGGSPLFGLAQLRAVVLISFSGYPVFLRWNNATKALSWSAVTAVAINIPLNYFLIFTLELGISGAAIASSLAEMGSLIVLCLSQERR